MVKPQIKLLCSHISHMALHFVWRDSGVAQKHGFELKVAVTGWKLNGEPPPGSWNDRAPQLLDGAFDFLSGLHHETYIYRARGDKRFVYLAQAQNDWDDRVVVSAEVSTPRDLEGKKFWVTTNAPCVYGNLRHALKLADVDLDRVEFVGLTGQGSRSAREIMESVARGDASAASVDLPFDYIGEQLGMHRLEIPSVPVIHNTTLCANREWVVRNEETTLAVLRSMTEAIHFFKTQRDKSCEILAERLAPLLDLRSFDEVEHLYDGWASLLSPKPYPHPLAVWNVYDLDSGHDPDVNFIGPFEIWDLSYLRTIDDEGFIDQLYGGAREAANPPVNAAI
ncbi:MAG TPA: ABC transporter substrate-binding protein [Chloroflexota bacterium]|nr:ABC transporter substrate-binding protein [Chloroflexota bacterium]